MTRSAILCMVVLLAALPARAEAQSLRAQASWTAGHVGGLVLGLEGRRPIGPEPELPLPGRPGGGPVEAPTRPWVLTGMFGLGLNVATPDDEPDVQGLIQGHGGILYRTGSSLISNVGGVVVLYLPEAVWGPAALVEAADLIDLQTGLLRAGGAWMGHVALTVAVPFLTDIF